MNPTCQIQSKPQMQSKVCVLTDQNACFRRALDGRTLEDVYLQEHGSIPIGVERIHEADFAVIVTCGFNEHAINTSRSLIDYARTFLKDENILIIGCLPGTTPQSLGGLKTSAVSPKSYQDIDRILVGMGAIDAKGRSFSDVNTGAFGLNHDDANTGQSIYYTKVSTGCAGKCTYCSIRFAIGLVQSRPLVAIQKEIVDAFRRGATGVYLGSDDLGAWGLDFKDTFPSLLRAILGICEQYDNGRHVDLRNVINPVWLVKYRSELEEIFAYHKDRLPTLSLALQSGSPSVLRSCKRFSNVEQIMETVCALHRANPSLYSFGHLIIGLPREGIAELQETLEFITSSPIDFWTCFKYSDSTKEKDYKLTAGDTTERNWQIFINSVRQRGFFVKEDSDRLYVAHRLNPKYIKIDFTKS